MPHVSFGETATRRSHDESRALTRLPGHGHWDDDNDRLAITRRRSRTISYKVPENDNKCQPVKCQPEKKPTEKVCIERKITYKDGDGNIIKIIYEDSCGKIIRTIYPTLPEPKPCPPPPPPKCASPPPISEPSNIPSEDVRNCNWTKIVVKNSRGVVWKIVHVNCDGKTMKTEYPEPEPRKRRSSETKRTFVRESEGEVSRRRYSETKKYVVGDDSRVFAHRSSSDGKSSVKGSDVHSASKGSNDDKTTVGDSDVQSSQKSNHDSEHHSRKDSVTSSRRRSADGDEEVVKDSSGVTRRVTYTDSRGRRRTVVYDDD
ncbi:hypothetical protein Q7P37_000933 [Cladosporium fusiforme]